MLQDPEEYVDSEYMDEDDSNSNEHYNQEIIDANINTQKLESLQPVGVSNTQYSLHSPSQNQVAHPPDFEKPPIEIQGVFQPDGWEYTEWPNDSGIWYLRAQKGESWERWEN